MFRFAVIWYLTLATAASPVMFCCCKSKGLLTSVRTTLMTPVRIATAPTTPACCHSESPAKSDVSRVPGEDPSRPCPCPQKDGKPALPTAEQDSLRSLVYTTFQILPWHEGVVTTLAVLDFSQADRISAEPALPFLSAQDLLRAHHQLRC